MNSVIRLRRAAVAAAILFAVVAPGCRKKVYQNPITKDTQQPDKVLFDTAVNDIEHGRYERARLTLQTLMNTYDNSEFLAKAKLAVADSWYREGGPHGFAQAEAEYKDFILFYPQMEEAAEAQGKVCQMQYQQMDKADRDNMHARRAVDECRTLLVQFPNSKFAPEAQQYLRDVQEVLADGEFKVGAYYAKKGSPPAAANRLQGLADQYPLFSESDEALWTLADSYHRMGDNFENQEAAAYSKIVQDYPLSAHVPEAKKKLIAMHRPVPDADPVAYAREKYEQENRVKRSMLAKGWAPFGGHPDTSTAARSGSPQMADFKPLIPASVPQSAANSGENSVTAAGGGGGDDTGVTAKQVTDPSLIDTAKDARQSTTGNNAPVLDPSQAKSATAPPTDPNAPNAAKALPQNHVGNLTLAQQQKLFLKQQEAHKKQMAVLEKNKKKLEAQQTKKKKKPAQQETPAATPAAAAPAAAPAPTDAKP